jgi:hypothetical protein
MSFNVINLAITTALTSCVIAFTITATFERLPPAEQTVTLAVATFTIGRVTALTFTAGLARVAPGFAMPIHAVFAIIQVA